MLESQRVRAGSEGNSAEVELRRSGRPLFCLLSRQDEMKSRLLTAAEQRTGQEQNPSRHVRASHACVTRVRS